MSRGVNRKSHKFFPLEKMAEIHRDVPMYLQAAHLEKETKYKPAKIASHINMSVLLATSSCTPETKCILTHYIYHSLYIIKGP